MLKTFSIKKISDTQKSTLKNRLVIAFYLFLFWLFLLVASLISSTDILERIFSISASNKQFDLATNLISSIFALFLIVPFMFLSYFEINKIYFEEITSITYLNRIDRKLSKFIKITTIKNRKSFWILTIMLSLSFFISTIALIVRSGILARNSADNINNENLPNDLSVILFLSMILSFSIWIITCIVIFKIFKLDNFRDIFTFLLITFFTNFGFICLFYIAVNQGIAVLCFLLVIVVCSDSFAYLGGLFFGKHKLSPKISPNKTIEGFVIGIFSSTLLTMALAGIFFAIDEVTHGIKKPLLLNGQSFLDSIVFGMYSDTPLISASIVIDNPNTKTAVVFISIFFLALIISLASSLGDIFFSYIKRAHDIKDYSSILKEHGGILDRFDSILFSSSFYIVCYFIVLVFLQFVE